MSKELSEADKTDRCAHGWVMPPECPSCLIVERDALSEEVRRLSRRVEDLNFIIAQERTTIDNTRRELMETETDLEKICLELLSGINSLAALLIEHHAASDDGTGSLICNICASKKGRQLWKESDEAKQKWYTRDKEKYGKAF